MCVCRLTTSKLFSYTIRWYWYFNAGWQFEQSVESLCFRYPVYNTPISCFVLNYRTMHLKLKSRIVVQIKLEHFAYFANIRVIITIAIEILRILLQSEDTNATSIHAC